MKVLAAESSQQQQQQQQLADIDEQVGLESSSSSSSSPSSPISPPPSSPSSSSISSSSGGNNSDDVDQQQQQQQLSRSSSGNSSSSSSSSDDNDEIHLSDDINNNNKAMRSSYETIINDGTSDCQMESNETTTRDIKKGGGVGAAGSAWRKLALSRGQRAKSRGDIFAALVKDRSGSIDFTSVIQSHMMMSKMGHLSVTGNGGNGNPANSCSQVNKHSDPFGSQDNIKSSWDLLCKIINCKMAFKKQFNGKKYNWIQLAGHAGRFRPGEREGYILKSMDTMERRCLEILRDDVLAPFVPTIDQTIEEGNDSKHYTEMQDLLYSFNNPCIMDIKIGVRTFLESDVSDQDEKETKPRHDLYVKLVELAPDEPTAEERVAKAITKRRYMSWRERSTCSATLGFRIEAIKKSHVTSQEFFKVREKKEVQSHIRSYTENNKNILKMYRDRLICLKEALERSEFFYNHELIGSSLLFVHDTSKVGVWMIDFGKTRPLPAGRRITHRDPWLDGNHEDGYLIGIQNLIDIFTEMI